MMNIGRKKMIMTTNDGTLEIIIKARTQEEFDFILKQMENILD